MWTERFNTRIAVEVGNKLADHFLAARANPGRNARKTPSSAQDALVQSLLAQVDRDVRPLRLGIFRRAKLANTFKWRLLEGGVDRAVADHLTQLLLLRLATKPKPA
jgi:plasmid stabilization system protein ParE